MHFCFFLQLYARFFFHYSAIKNPRAVMWLVEIVVEGQHFRCTGFLKNCKSQDTLVQFRKSWRNFMFLRNRIQKQTNFYCKYFGSNSNLIMWEFTNILHLSKGSIHKSQIDPQKYCKNSNSQIPFKFSWGQFKVESIQF